MARHRELFTAALRDSPDSPVSLFNLGTDYSRSGDFDRAELLLARASELYPGYYKARMNYAQLLRLRGKVREAEEILVSLAERWPGSGATFLALGELHLAERRVELAVGAYGKAVEIAPENGLARAGLARALVTAGRRTEASEQARKAASLAPEDPMVILQSAQALLDAGLREEASGLLMRAVELPATSAHFLNSLAEVCFRAGLMEQAAAALDRAEAAGPDLSITHYNRALLLRRREDLVGAERELRRALSLSPGDARARVRLAQILARSGRTDEALAEATAAVQADASFADARIARADIHIARQAYSEAEQDLRAALVLQPSSALAHYNLGLLLARSGRRAEALQHVATAAQLDPRKADYANALETLRRGGMSAAGR